MSDLKALLEHADRAVADVPLPDGGLEGLQRHRDRKRRDQRIAAGVVGIAVFVAAIWIVTSAGSFDRTQTPAVPGGAETGPRPTPPAGTGPETYLIDLNTGQMTPLPKSIAGFGYSVSPDGTKVAYLSQDDAGIFIASLDGTDVQQVSRDRRAGAPDWSPDGEAIAYHRRSGAGDVGDIFVLDLATGEISQVTNTKPTTEACCGPPGAAYPQFSPDGASIVYEFARGDSFSVRIVPVTGGKSVLLVGGGKNNLQAFLPTFSPDGSTLAVACSGRLEGICIADADGRNLRVLVSGPWGSPEWSPDGTRIAYINFEYNPHRVFVVDVATGETTFVAEGAWPEWLDDHTLIVER
jgi:Tol biopolymer transport system component